MVIKVTQEDIDNGTKNSQGFCPIAIALQRELNIKCLVDYSEIVIGSMIEDPIKIVDLPRLAESFVYLFDAGDPVQPFEFELPYEPINQ